MVGYIYKYENILNHKIYIGQTINLDARKASHISKSKTVKNKFYNAVRKYGWESFYYSVIAQVDAEDIKELSSLLDSLEEQYIEQYDSFKKGYNSTTGGHSCRERKMPDSYIEYCKNRVYSKDTRRKMSESHKKVKYSLGHRQKLRDAALRRNFSAYREETTEKRNASIRKALSKKVLQLNKEGKVINEFASMKEAVKFIKKYLAQDKTEKGILNGIHRHCNHKIKSKYYYGFEWKFKPIV